MLRLPTPPMASPYEPAMPLPNFVVLGPPRTATTWLFTALSANPSVGLSSRKEVRFFDENYDRGLDWYARQFDQVEPTATAVGDITPAYFARHHVIARMRRDLPEPPTLLVIYRDPVERAFSEYRGRLRRGETTDDFVTALGKFPEMVANSSYGLNMRRWIDAFGPDKMVVLQFDRVASDPAAVLEQVCTSIGVASVGTESIDQVINAATPPAKFKSFRSVLRGGRRVLETTTAGRKIMWSLRRSGWVNRLQRGRSSTPSAILGDDDRLEAQKYFVDDHQLWKRVAPQTMGWSVP